MFFFCFFFHYFLLSLYLKPRKQSMSMLTLLERLLMCSSHLQLFWRVILRCLWWGFSSSTTLPNVSWCIGFMSRLILTSSVSYSLNLTFQSFAYSLIFARSFVNVSVLISGLVWPNDTLVSSTNNLITGPILRTISLIKIRNNRGPSADPWGTPEGFFFSTDFSPLITTACVQSVR